jgi:hypothetical protein
MRKSLCGFIMLLPVILVGLVNGENDTRSEEISKAWIKVHWSNGGRYWHNTITREDRDEL